MQLYSHYVYPLNLDHHNEVTSAFPADAYSQYKYGNAAAAVRLGEELFHTIISRFGDWLLEETVYVTASAYKQVPTAAQQLANVFLTCCMQAGYDNFHPFVIEREEVFAGDYGKLSEEARAALMAANKLSTTQDLKGQRVLVIDDVRITGRHEQRVRSLMQEKQVDTLISAYVGKLLDTQGNAQIEHRLNHSWVNSLPRLAEMAAMAGWTANARVCKYLLGYEEVSELLTFWSQLTENQQITILSAMVSDGYAVMPCYMERFGLLATHVHHQDADIRLSDARDSACLTERAWTH